MKTILEIAKECGASVCNFINEDFRIGNITFDDDAQLTATIDLWNRQNSEPIGWFTLPDGYHGYQQMDKEYEGSDVIPLFTAPPEPPASQELIDYVDRLEKALQFYADGNHYDYSDKQSSERCGLDWVIEYGDKASEALQSKPAKG